MQFYRYITSRCTWPTCRLWHVRYDRTFSVLACKKGEVAYNNHAFGVLLAISMRSCRPKLTINKVQSQSTQIGHDLNGMQMDRRKAFQLYIVDYIIIHTYIIKVLSTFLLPQQTILYFH